MNKPIRIVVFTVDDLEFVPDLLEPVIDCWGESIIKAYVSRSLFDFQYFRRNAMKLLREGYPFCIRLPDLLRFAAMKIWWGHAHRRNVRNMVDFLRTKKLDAEYIAEIDSEEVLATLKALHADVFLFAAFDRIARHSFLSIPRIGTFNTHMGKLPEYRGGLSAFWVLRFGDADAGITVHRAVEKLDAGDIVAETRFPVTTRSMFELMHETFAMGAATVNKALNRLARGDWEPISTDGRTTAYFRIPKGKDFEEFYRRGCRLI
jgi:folate-dependent phosphoribosylglycinamide formyltransferase PurN